MGIPKLIIVTLSFNKVLYLNDRINSILNKNYTQINDY